MQDNAFTRGSLKTPRAAAIAGILFSVLMLAILLLFQLSMPHDSTEPGAWLATHSGAVTLALNLVPLDGLAFLWFVAVLRDRAGTREDRFFATVFFGSALLFIAMLFAAGAVFGALVLAFAVQPDGLIDSPTFHLARALAYNLVNVYAIKMAGVFMMSTSMLAIRTGFVPRWLAVAGIASATVLLLGSYYIPWSVLLLPLWVSLLSAEILIDNFRPRRPDDPSIAPAAGT